MLIKLLNVSYAPDQRTAVPEHNSCGMFDWPVWVVTKLKRIPGIEDNYEQIRENYPSLIEETQLQVYENVLPESQFHELDKNFHEGDWPKFG